MAIETENQADEQPLRFNMRTLLIAITCLCVVGTLLAKTLDPRHQIGAWIMVVVYAFLGWYLPRKYKSDRRRIARISTEGVAVRVDPKWLRRQQSRWYLLLGACTGVSITFAPMCLIWCGDVSNYGPLQWVLAPLCVLMIYFVPGYYMRLAGEVMAQLHELGKSPTQDSTSSDATASDTASSQ